MCLKGDEYLDATKRAGLGRFLNHSCNPNCHLQKWIIGRSYRIGIFSKRPIAKGEELTFDYQFERYGAAAQKCLCGEPKCKGTIGISKEVDQSAVDGSDEGDQDFESDSEEKRVVKRTVAGLSDPEKVAPFVSKALQNAGVPKQIIKMLDQLAATDSQACLKRLVHVHGLLVFRNWIKQHAENTLIIKKILNILPQLPINTRNTIQKYHLDTALEPLGQHKDLMISALSKKLMADWNKLELVYKIPKRAASLSTVSATGETSTANKAEKRPAEDERAGNGGSTTTNHKRVREDVHDQQYQRRNSYAPSTDRRSLTNGSLSNHPMNNGRDPYRPSGNGSGYDTYRPRTDSVRDRDSRYHHQRRDDRSTLPSGWMVAYDSTGRYYLNRSTGETARHRELIPGPSPPHSSSHRGDPRGTRPSTNHTTEASSTSSNDKVVSVSPVPIPLERSLSTPSHREHLPSHMDATDPPPSQHLVLAMTDAIDGVPKSAIELIIERAQIQKMEEEQQRVAMEKERERKRGEREKAKLKLKQDREAQKQKERERGSEKRNKTSPSSVAKSTISTGTGPASGPVSRVDQEALKKPLREELSAYVVKVLSRSQHRFTCLDEFKKLARKLTHLILEKEQRDSSTAAATATGGSGGSGSGSAAHSSMSSTSVMGEKGEKGGRGVLGEEKKKKVRKFVESYVEKWLSKQQASDQAVPTPPIT